MGVFVFGSKSIFFEYDNPLTVLGPVYERVDELVQNGTDIIISDSWGMGYHIQTYLAGKKYKNVTVYTSGKIHDVPESR